MLSKLQRWLLTLRERVQNLPHLNLTPLTQVDISQNVIGSPISSPLYSKCLL